MLVSSVPDACYHVAVLPGQQQDNLIPICLFGNHSTIRATKDLA